MVYIPNFKSEFLTQIATGFRKETKSLKQSSCKLQVDRVRVIEDGVESETLEVLMAPRNRRSGGWIEFQFWDDRWCWMNVANWGKQEKHWNWNMEGRILLTCSFRELFIMIRHINSIALRSDASAPDKLDEMWGPFIATGPKAADTKI